MGGEYSSSCFTNSRGWLHCAHVRQVTVRIPSPCNPYGTHYSKEEIMSDDLTKTGAQDRARINVNEAHEVTYWTNELGVTKDRLQQLVKEVGPSAKAVREKLAAG